MPSVYACDVHGRRIRGALEGIRITLLYGTHRVSRKLRVCPDDLDGILQAHINDWTLVSDEGFQSDAAMRAACGHEIPAGTRLVPAFIYVWRRGDEQREYYADYCPDCADSVRQLFGLMDESEPAHATRVGDVGTLP